MNHNSQRLVEINHQMVTADKEGSDVYLDGLSIQILAQLIAVEADDYLHIKQLNDGIQNLGLTEQKSFWALNKRLQYNLQKLLSDAKAGGQITQLIKTIQHNVSQIKPPKQSIINKFKSMFMLLFSWHETTWDVWLEKYPQLKADINSQISQLDHHKKLLSADISTLYKDRLAFDKQISQLENSCDLLVLLANKVQDIQTYKPETDIQNLAVINNEFLPLVEQRKIELHQQLLIARQAMLTIELFIKQNETQLNSIDQTVQTASTVMDVTAGILLVKNSQDQLAQVSQKFDAENTTIDHAKLKQARHVIDQALNKLENLELKSIQSAEQLLDKSELPADK